MSIFAKARAEYALKRAEKTNKKAEASLLGHAAKKTRRELPIGDPIPPPETTVEAPAAAAPDAAHAPAAVSASMPGEQTHFAGRHHVRLFGCISR